jgi:uncharacterized phage protein (TIGR02220 family)
MSKEAYYFSHDSNARHDPKILALRSEYGIEGYGIYWVIVEMLREANEYKLPTKAYIWNAIAMQVQCKDYDKDDAKRFVEFCINECELFESDEQFFWSKSLLNRMDKKNDVSKKRSEAAKARWEKRDNSAVSDKKEDANVSKSNANAMQNNANAMQTDAIKGKEIKEKENIYIVEIVEYLNSVCGKRFSPKTEGQIKYIRARLGEEGITVEDLKRVIDTKAAQWLGTDNEKYLRPSTLFNSEKFEGYLNEKSTRVNIGTHNKQNEEGEDFLARLERMKREAAEQGE